MSATRECPGRIHGLCIVKDESDIIEASLRAAATWCDHIYVLDNGSTDETWEVVQRIARSITSIVPYHQEDKPFTNGSRSQIFNAFRDQARLGDWWCRLDADEFYLDNPRVFLSKVPARCGLVWNASISYYFTDRDAERYKQDASLFADSIPIQDRLRYYLCHWSEIRFMRHSPALSWPNGTTSGWPVNLSSLFSHYPLRIAVRHYPYRSPMQIECRLKVRVGNGTFSHEAWKNWGSLINPDRIKGAVGQPVYLQDSAPTNWESRIVPAEQLDWDCGDGRFVMREELMPGIPSKTWRDSPLLRNTVAHRLKVPIKAIRSAVTGAHRR
jgi:glycosyltransferase involved in cell wall biosynthesis